MKYASTENQRKSIRLPGYDYSQPGAYFVTVCTRYQECMFGEIQAEEMILNRLGHIVETTWTALPEHYSHIQLDMFVVMPNHAHGVIFLVDHETPNIRAGSAHTVGEGCEPKAAVSAEPVVGAGLKPAPTRPKRHGLPEIVRAFKTFSSRRINEFRGTAGMSVWQRGYYERVMRNEVELNRIRDYILGNPNEWETDTDNPFLGGVSPSSKRFR